MRETLEHRYEARRGDVIARTYVRAVKGGTRAGYWDTMSQTWSELDGPQPPCAECWAGLNHTGPGWAQHQAATP
jgi:hypothetical protein